MFKICKATVAKKDFYEEPVLLYIENLKIIFIGTVLLITGFSVTQPPPTGFIN